MRSPLPSNFKTEYGSLYLGDGADFGVFLAASSAIRARERADDCSILSGVMCNNASVPLASHNLAKNRWRSSGVNVNCRLGSYRAIIRRIEPDETLVSLAMLARENPQAIKQRICCARSGNFSTGKTSTSIVTGKFSRGNFDDELMV